MESFRWDRHFETGLAEVDQQHYHLVEIINQFGEHLSENEIVSEEVETIFGELANYAEYHFREEEHLMSGVGIDPRHLESHIETHRGFLQEVVSMHANVSPDKPDSLRHLLDFLIHWLAYHILGSDQNMARQIEAIRSGATCGDAYRAEELESDSATEPLLRALDGLFQEVSARNRELVRLNQSLEETVAIRTRALSEANLHLEQLSLTDTLTGLPNRRHAMRRLESLWTESRQLDRPLACMMIDADHFKQVNDGYGHDSGDAVLRELARTLRHSVRNDDVVCRLGGDEFLIICPNTDLEGARYIGEHTREAVSALRVPTGDGFWNGSVSIGVAVGSAEMQSHEDLIKLADKKVYVAKRDGKNCVR